MNHAVFGDDPTWDWKTFDFDRDQDLAMQKLGRLFDATDPDLRDFKAHGGKVLMCS